MNDRPAQKARRWVHKSGVWLLTAMVNLVVPALAILAEIKREGRIELLYGLIGEGIGFAVGLAIVMLNAGLMIASNKLLDATLKRHPVCLSTVVVLEPFLVGAGLLVAGWECGRFLGSMLVKLFR